VAETQHELIRDISERTNTRQIPPNLALLRNPDPPCVGCIQVIPGELSISTAVANFRHFRRIQRFATMKNL
jgi:hypothetical protein